MRSLFDQFIEVEIAFKQYNYRVHLRHKSIDLNIIRLMVLVPCIARHGVLY